MLNPAYVRMVWHRNRGLAVFAAILVVTLQFVVIRLVSSVDVQPVLDVLLKPLTRARLWPAGSNR